MMQATHKDKSIDIQVTEITLLSAEEARALPKHLRMTERYYWLRSRSDTNSEYAMCMSGDGDVFEGRVIWPEHIRPALKINNLKDCNLAKGDVFSTSWKDEWIVIDDNTALYFDKEGIGCSAFREYAYSARKYFWAYASKRPKIFSKHPLSTLNDYEHSDVKRLIDKWAAKNGIEIEKTA